MSEASVRRRLPRWSELAPLMQTKRFERDATKRRLDRCLTIWDLRELARRRTPRAVFDYTDGAAGLEIGLARARQAYTDVEFQPSVLRDVSDIDLTTDVLGTASALPFGFAPTGFTRLMHHAGELAVAAVADRIGVPYALSTMGTTSIEAVADAYPKARRWFQLYIWRDRGAGEDLMNRARAAGYDTLIVTVDSPVPGPRLRDQRNGFAIPPQLMARTVADAARHPRWWLNLLTTEPLSFTSLASWDKPLAELLPMLFDPGVTEADLEWVRSYWNGPLVIKGVQTAQDAARMVDAGADAVWLSNHGGRQLDRAPVPLRMLPEAVQRIQGRAQVFVDTGIMSGGDMVAALAVGADAVFVGRAYLYGLMAGGERGVARVAEILAAELRRTMALLGVASVAELSERHARLRPT